TNLTSLDLGNNQIKELPEFIGQLTNLTSLYLRGIQIKELPEFIGQLTNLTSLDLSDNQLKELPEFIGQLTNLTSLDLSDNQLKELPEFIGQLTNLTSLDLSGIQIKELPEFIGQLTNLTSLNLWNNQLKELPEFIGQLTNLTSLDLDNTQLKELPEFIGQLINLTSLDLRNNQLKELPEVVYQLKNLNSLILWNNKISLLPNRIRTLTALETLDVRANRLPIPPEVLGEKDEYGRSASATKVIDYYFQEKSESPLYEAKLLIVGEGEAGKTTLAKKLQDPKYELKKDEKSTEGIKVLPYEFNHPDGNPCKVNIWDFGGQEIYHATHQFFLTKRAVYALVTDSRQGNTDFYFWLNIIQIHGGDSPVIIIKNEKNDRPCAVPDLQLRGQFKNLKESIEVNLADNRNLGSIEAAVQKHIIHQPHVGDPMIKTWANVRSVLENQALGSDNYISIQDYRKTCADQGIPDREEQDRLSRFLHDLGVFLHFQSIPALAKTIFLTPSWSTDAVYKALDTPKVRKDCGRFSSDDLNKIWNDNQYADVRGELLALMQEFEVCYEITGRKHHYIAPHLLEANLPEHLQYQDDWDTNNNLILTYHYPFKPKNIFPRFIVALHRYIEKQRLVWKHGVVLIIGNARAEIIEDARYDAANINIRISGNDKKRVLAIIGHELERIHSSFEKLTYQTLIPCNCAECRDSQKPYQFSYNVLQNSLKRSNFDIQCQTSFEMVNVRRLIDDVIEPPQTYDPESYEDSADSYRPKSTKKSTQSPFNNTYNVTLNLPEQRYEESSTINVDGDVNDATLIAGKNNEGTQSSQVDQHGKGDNFAGNKIEGDSIHTQINASQDIQDLSEILDNLIADISEDYSDLSKPRIQSKIQREALESINDDPDLKLRLTNTVKAGLNETLEQLVKNPLAKIVIKSLKGFFAE
ncbi:MAG: COR domain-containing protein, partial [Cyanobacteria bacterium J06627_28]